MKTAALLVLVLLPALVACDRQETTETPDGNAKAAERPAATSSSPTTSPLDSIRQLGQVPANEQPRTLATHIHHVADEDLPAVVEHIAGMDDPEIRPALLATVFDETTLRSPLVRLPLLLEIARQQHLPPGLHDTIMAELGTAVRADHGTSWGDWALAIEEHLADSSGLIRVSD